MIAPLLLVAALALQPPSPSAGSEKGQPQAKQTQPAQPNAAPVERGTDANPVVVRTQPSDRQAAEDQQDRDDQRTNRRYALWLSVVTSAVLAIQVWLLIRQNSIMREQSGIMAEQREAAASSANAAAEAVKLTEKQQAILEQQHATLSQQGEHMAASLQAARDNASAALKSGEAAERSAAATVELKRIASSSLVTSQEIERAYIYISHKDVYVMYGPDGSGGSDPTKPLRIRLTVKIRNGGRTPGNILGGFIGYRISTEAGLPDLTRTVRNMTPAFLLPDGHVEFGFEVGIDRDPALANVFSQTNPELLWLIGEVHYSDRFGQMHSGGYGRCFTHQNQTVNFSFVPETGPYNFDKPLSPQQVQRYVQ